MTGRTIMMLAAILGALAVVIGAFGAHALPGWLRAAGMDENTIARREETFETGARYHFYHALALFLVGLLQSRQRTRTTVAAAVVLSVGIAIFSGGLYVYSLTGNSLFARIVPLGGMSLIAGWLCLAVAAATHPQATPHS